MSSAHLIFLVEDNADDALLMERAVGKARWKGGLEIFRDGAAAIQRLARSSPSDLAAPTLLLLDLKLPGLSGFEVLSWIRQAPAWARLRVVILTSSQLESDRQRALQLGADGFLVKPSSFEELVQLARVLEEWVKEKAEPRDTAVAGSAEPNSRTTSGEPRGPAGCFDPALTALLAPAFNHGQPPSA